MDLDFEVVDLPPADHPTEGERAPEFVRPLVTGEFWEDRALSSLTDEGPVLLLPHPMAGSFPATYLWQAVVDRGWTDRLRVVGLTASDPYACKRLLDDRGVDAAIFSDPGSGVADAYGIAHELDGMAGIVEPRPAAFLLDEECTVRYAWVAAEWPAFPDYDAIGAAIDDLLA